MKGREREGVEGMAEGQKGTYRSILMGLMLMLAILMS